MPQGIYDRKKAKPNSGYFQKGHAVLDEWKEKALKVNFGNTYASGKRSDITKKNISEALKGKVPWNKGIPHTEEAKSKMRNSQRKRFENPENHPRWKGGDIEIICKECREKFIIPYSRKDTASFCSKKCYWKNSDNGLSKESHKIRESVKYKQWREKVYKRDNYLCQMPNCNGKEKYLNAHHIKTFKEYPELIFEVSNGITLCRKCHLKILYKEKQYENLFNEIIKCQLLKKF